MAESPAIELASFPPDGSSAHLEWVSRSATPLALRYMEGRHCGHVNYLTEEDARALFNWLGVQLHRQG